MDTPEVVVFDVNETLSDLAPLEQRFAEIGAPSGLAATWFAGVLRDGFALTAVGATAGFADIGRSLLRAHLHRLPTTGDPDAAAEHVLDGFTALPVHPDVVAGVRALTAAGFRLLTLSNGAASVAEGLLDRAGVRDAFERVLTVAGSGTWKPAAAAYAVAAAAVGVPLERMMLVAVHPWDVDGASRAGMRTAWVDRDGGAPYPEHFNRPDLTVSGIDDLAGRLSPAGS